MSEPKTAACKFISSKTIVVPKPGKFPDVDNAPIKSDTSGTGNIENQKYQKDEEKSAAALMHKAAELLKQGFDGKAQKIQAPTAGAAKAPTGAGAPGAGDGSYTPFSNPHNIAPKSYRPPTHYEHPDFKKNKVGEPQPVHSRKELAPQTGWVSDMDPLTVLEMLRQQPFGSNTAAGVGTSAALKGLDWSARRADSARFQNQQTKRYKMKPSNLPARWNRPKLLPGMGSDSTAQLEDLIRHYGGAEYAKDAKPELFEYLENRLRAQARVNNRSRSTGRELRIDREDLIRQHGGADAAKAANPRLFEYLENRLRSQADVRPWGVQRKTPLQNSFTTTVEGVRPTRARRLFRGGAHHQALRRLGIAAPGIAGGAMDLWNMRDQNTAE